MRAFHASRWHRIAKRKITTLTAATLPSRPLDALTTDNLVRNFWMKFLKQIGS